MIERSGDPLFFTRNLQSDTVESEQDAEAIENSKRFVDLKRNIDNTLFRGNSILTKSLERYMRIVGSALLERRLALLFVNLLQMLRTWRLTLLVSTLLILALTACLIPHPQKSWKP